MKKVALICDKCGSPLVYSGQMVATCGSCGVPWALVEEKQDVLTHVSYFPIPAPGKMAVPFKIKLGWMIRENTDFMVADGALYDSDLYFDEQDVVRNDDLEIGEDLDDYLVIAKGCPKEVVTDVVRKPWHLKQPTPKIQEPQASKMMRIIVSEVVANRRTVGHTAKIQVRNVKWEKDANFVCALIQQHFNVLPVCTLVKK